MGIERFFNSLVKNDIANLNENFTKKNVTDGTDTTDLYIDFNAIIYTVTASVLSNFNGILYGIITNNEKKIKKHKNYGIKITNNPNIFVDDVNDNITNIILDETENYTLNLLNALIIPEKLKLLYIAVDGVPTKAKMIEQRNRRYMAYIISAIQKKIFQKHETKLQKDPTRYKYEMLKISWNKNFITPGTTFMDLLDARLKSIAFARKVKKICSSLDIYYYSGSRVIGEGEKKIFNHLRKSNYEIGKYSIYSTDSDVILLCLLLNTPTIDRQNRYITQLKMIRHNPQTGEYDVIDVDKLKNNISEYTNNIDCINDIVFLLTIFGNDFLPKIHTYDAKYDFDKIIKIYKDSNIKIIIDKKLNFNNLIVIFQKLVDYEKNNAANNYILNKYKNGKKFGKDPITKLKENKLFGDALLSHHDNNVEFGYHASQIRKIVDSIDPLLKVHEYDKELYSFEHKMGKYTKLLNAKDIDIGKVKIINNKLKIRSMKKSKVKYYKRYFKIDDDFTLKNKIIYDATENYVEGLTWLFFYYYYDIDDDIYDLLWYFKYHAPPMLGHILKYLKYHLPKNQVDFFKYARKKDKITNDIVPIIMSPLELLFYVTPCLNVKEVIPKQFQKYINESFYYDLDNVVNAIMSGKGKKYIDCSGHTFLSKCMLNIKKSNVTDEEFIKKMEEIPHEHNGDIIIYNNF